MKAAYIDTSCLLAVAFSEPGAAVLAELLDSYDVLLSSNLLEAEMRSALRREEVTADAALLMAPISWTYPDRPLTKEIAQVLKAGYVRGADLWHLAVALFIDPARDIDFLTLDVRQRDICRQLGFDDSKWGAKLQL